MNKKKGNKDKKKGHRLNKKLTNPIAEENYEFAARVRDEIKRRN